MHSLMPALGETKLRHRRFAAIRLEPLGSRVTLQVVEKFQEFLRAANAPGALDAPTKQAIAIALSVLTRCEPCTKAHIAKARKMGFTQAEIDEAAWMAIAFGGSPTMMFVNGIVSG